MKGWRRITALMCAVMLTVGSMPVCRGVEEKWVTRRYAEIGLCVTIPAGWTKVTDERYFDMRGEMYDINGWPDSVFAFSAEDMCEYPELKGYGGRAELDELLMTDEAIQATGEAFFEDGYTTSVRKCGAKEYHWLEGVVDAKTGASMAIALRMDNGFLYMFRIFSPQLHEVLSYFEEILSGAEYWDWIGRIEQPETGGVEALPDGHDQTENTFRVEEAGLSLSLTGWDGYVYTRQLQGEGAELKNARPTDPEILREMEESNTYLLVRPTQEDGGDWELRLLCTKNEGPEHHLLSPEELMDLMHQLDTSELMELGFEWIEHGLLVHPQTQMIRMEAAMAGWIDCGYEVGYGEKRVTLGISYDVEKAGEEIRQRAEQTALSMRFDGLTERMFALEHGATGTKLVIPVGWTWDDTEPEPGFEQTVFYNSVLPDTAVCLSTIPMDQLMEQEEGANPTEYDEWTVIDELVKVGGEEAFVGEHTDTVRQFGGKEYRWLEGESVLDDLPVGLVFALRPDNGVLYGFQMTSAQTSEAMADFEQILSDVEYPGQSEPVAEDAFRVEEAGLSLSLTGWDGYVYTRQLQGEGAELKNAVQTDPVVLRFMELSDAYLVVHPTQEWGEGWEVRVSCTDNEFSDYNELTLERLKLIGEARKQELLADGYEWSEYGVMVHPQTQLIVTNAVEEGRTVYTYEAGVGKSRVVLTITFDGDEVSQEEIQRANQIAQSMWFDGLEESAFSYVYEDPEHRLTIPPGWIWVPTDEEPESAQDTFYKPSWPGTGFSLVLGEPKDVPEEWTQDSVREWIQEKAVDCFVGKYTISAREYGRWEYHCVEGNTLVDGEETPMALAIRLDNGIMYLYILVSAQMPEAMADFEQILSDAEYSGQYDPSWVEGDTGIAPGVVVLGVGAAVAVLCGAAILFRRCRGEKSE